MGWGGVGWGGVGWGQFQSEASKTNRTLPPATHHIVQQGGHRRDPGRSPRRGPGRGPRRGPKRGPRRGPRRMANFRGSDWPSRTSEAKDTVWSDLATFLSILGSPPGGAPTGAPGGAPGERPQEGPQEGPPDRRYYSCFASKRHPKGDRQIADTVCVLHPKRVGNKTHFCALPILGPTLPRLWRGSAGALPRLWRKPTGTLRQF